MFLKGVWNVLSLLMNTGLASSVNEVAVSEFNSEVLKVKVAVEPRESVLSSDEVWVTVCAVRAKSSGEPIVTL